MNDIEKPSLDMGYRMVCCGVREYAKHIDECYSDVGISVEQVEQYQTHAVHDQDLWIAVMECGQDTIIASGIAEIDTTIREGVLEWIQVSPKYRGKGLGKFVVNELLWRMKDKVDFTIVSGKVNNTTNPRSK